MLPVQTYESAKPFASGFMVVPSICNTQSQGKLQTNVYVPPQIHMLKPYFSPTPCNDTRRWGSWKVIKIRHDFESGAFTSGISDLLRVLREGASGWLSR